MNIESGTLGKQEQICEQIRKAGGEVFFSVSDDKIIGYYAYIVVKDEELQCNIVNEIKMFSFDQNRSDVTLVKDFKIFLDMLLDKYPVVSWNVSETDKSNNIYGKVIEDYHWHRTYFKNNIKYCINDLHARKYDYLKKNISVKNRLNILEMMEIQPKLVKVDMKTLKKQMQDDVTLNELLMKPITDIPEVYKHFLKTCFNKSLYNVISLSTCSPLCKQGYFLMQGNKILAWCSFFYGVGTQYYQRIINDIQMFSFDVNSPEKAIETEFRLILDVLLQKYLVVCWHTEDVDIVNKICNTIISDYSGICRSSNNRKVYKIDSIQDNKEQKN